MSDYLEEIRAATDKVAALGGTPQDEYDKIQEKALKSILDSLNEYHELCSFHEDARASLRRINGHE